MDASGIHQSLRGDHQESVRVARGRGLSLTVHPGRSSSTCSHQAQFTVDATQVVGARLAEGSRRGGSGLAWPDAEVALLAQGCAPELVGIDVASISYAIHVIVVAMPCCCVRGSPCSHPGGGGSGVSRVSARLDAVRDSEHRVIKPFAVKNPSLCPGRFFRQGRSCRGAGRHRSKLPAFSTSRSKAVWREGGAKCRPDPRPRDSPEVRTVKCVTMGDLWRK